MQAAARQGVLVIACGALGREIAALRLANAWNHMAVSCLPAELHNRPQLIPEAVREKIRAQRANFDSIFVAYADCGTGGLLDKMLQEEGVERIGGAHCYEFFAGSEVFAQMADAEPGTFYLTDFLLRHFERLVWRGLGLDKHPQLLPQYFGNYTRLMYLAQLAQPGQIELARVCADRLGLAFESRVTGYGELANSLQAHAGAIKEQRVVWQN